MGTILMRLIPPGTLVRQILPVVLTRPVAPLLAWATVVPTSSISASSAAVAAVDALGAAAKAPIMDRPELLVVVGVVAVDVVEDVERSVAF